MVSTTWERIPRCALRKCRTRPERPHSALFWRRRRFDELRVVNRDVRLYFRKRILLAPAYPSVVPLEGHHNPRHGPIIGVVDLRGNAADRRIGVAHHANQQVGLLIEIKGREETKRPASLHNVHVVAIDIGWIAHSPSIEK